MDTIYLLALSDSVLRLKTSDAQAKEQEECIRRYCLTS